MRSRVTYHTAPLRGLAWTVLALLQATAVTATEELRITQSLGTEGAGATTTHPAKAPSQDAEWWSERLGTRLSADEVSRSFWPRRLAMLFERIELTPEQLAGIDALFTEAQDERERVKRLVAQRDAARAAGEAAQADALEEEIEGMRTALRPTRRMERLATVLSADQQSTYHMNRARVYEKSQRSERWRRPRQSQPTEP